MAATEITIRLPKPHPKQLAFLRSPAKRKVIVAGRRAGKTTGVSMLAAEALLRGRRVLYAAPTQDQTEVFWAACKRYFGSAIRQKLVYMNKTQRLMELPGGGRIRAKTAWDADSLRGDFADLLILEEWALMDPNAWGEVGAPMLLDNDGDAVFIFTPKRRNHAHRTYVEAMQDTSGRWGVWHFTSLDNPYLSREALAEITKDMTDEAYRQEILAEFLENQGTVFRNLAACMNVPADATPEDHYKRDDDGEPLTDEAGNVLRHRIVAGVDWGKLGDATACSIVCADCRVELANVRFAEADYTLQRLRLGELWQYWGVTGILPERNAAGDPVIEDLQNEGWTISPGPDGKPGFMTTAATKPPLIESLRLAFERVECQWIADPVWTAELESYECKISPQTGRSTYSAPEGIHDDTVIARAVAWWEVLHGGPGVETFENPFYR